MSSSRECSLSRYACEEIRDLFSRRNKFRLWRQLWIYLAEAEQELGLDISDEQIRQMKNKVQDINLSRIEELEEETRHEVMANIRAFGEQCPEAESIIHLGATSMFVMDNADLITFKKALGHLGDLLANVVDKLSEFAGEYSDHPILGLTHLQPAQVTTVGKRACLWLSDFLDDLKRIRNLQDTLPFRGVKGAVGTQASYLQLFDGDSEKVKKLDQIIAEKAGFENLLTVTGQTYPRKIDSKIQDFLSHIAQSAGKFSVDIRLLQSRNEMQEPMKSSQVGSSAMAYKKNPIRTERITGLSRYLIENAGNASHTAANQWMERSLDDSSNRRILFSHTFQAADGLLRTVLNCSQGLVVHGEKIKERLDRELPYLVTENVLMEIVRQGGSRQQAHEKIRQLSREAAEHVEKGGENDLLERMKEDPEFENVRDRIDSFADPSVLIGRAREQVDEFLSSEVKPVLKKEENLGMKASLEV